MKRKLLWLNVAIIIPCLLVIAGILPYGGVILLSLVISMVNLCFANSKKSLIVYNSILFVCSITGIILDSFERKIYGVGFHPEVTEEYQLLIGYFVFYSLIITGVEVVLKHFLDKRR